jgi:hypothetical protein
MDWVVDFNPLNSAIALAAPAVIYGTFLVNRRRDDRRLLSIQFDCFLTLENQQRVTDILAADKNRIVVEPELRAQALDLLLALQRIARSVTDNPNAWEAALDHHWYHRLHDVVDHCGTLVQVIRHTDLPMDRRPWNGDRSKAFDALLRALRVKLPKS